MENINWENIISASRISCFTAGAHIKDICDWVYNNTNYDYLCFNGIVYKVTNKNYIETKYKLDYFTRCFYKTTE